MTGGGGGVGVATSAPTVAGAISRELADLRPLAQFPEEIACILTQQEQELYQRVRARGRLHTAASMVEVGCGDRYTRVLIVIIYIY